jgi:two-component system chemotaxis response regulator CheB
MPNKHQTLNTVVVDDTSLFRRITTDVLGSIPDINVVGSAVNGQEALELIIAQENSETGPVDLVFLDVEMPVMNGLETLKELKKRDRPPTIVMVSGHSQSHMAITIEALSQGAYDFIGKPEGSNAEESKRTLRQQLFGVVRSLLWQRQQQQLRQRQGGRSTRYIGNHLPTTAELSAHHATAASVLMAPAGEDTPSAIGTAVFNKQNPLPQGALSAKHGQRQAQPQAALQMGQGGAARASQTSAASGTPSLAELAQQGRNSGYKNHARPSKQPASAAPDSSSSLPSTTAAAPRAAARKLAIKPKIVLVGISTGGPAALTQFIPKLPANLGVPVVVVQHMPPKFTKSLADSLNAISALQVKEAQAGETLQPNTVYIAPGGYHTVLQQATKRGAITVGLTEDEPVNSCRPAVDVLFKSAAPIFAGANVSVIMTGMGRDGCDGVKALQQHGTHCLTQEASTCVVYGMPKAVDDAHLSDEQVALEALAGRVTQLVGSVPR